MPAAKLETARPAVAAEMPRSALMKPVSVGMPWSITDTPICAVTATPSTRQAVEVAAERVTGARL